MRKIGLLVLLVVVSCSTFAASWPSSGPARKVVTLVVCSNNKSSRLLAELIQAESKQPYLLLPAPQSGDSRIFFIPARGPAHQIKEAHLDSFVRFLNPGRVVVLGNSTYVPPRYLKKFDPNVPMFISICNDWQRIAEELTFMLNISGLDSDYKRLRDQMLSDSRIYRPISKPSEAAPQTYQPATSENLDAPAIEATPAVEDTPAVEETTVVEDTNVTVSEF